MPRNHSALPAIASCTSCRSQERRVRRAAGCRKDYIQDTLVLPLLCLFFNGIRDPRFDRQFNKERGTFSRDAAAFSPQASAVHLDKLAADRQAQPCAASLACGGGIHLCKLLEDSFQ